MNKMLMSLSTIIEQWNETCSNQESGAQVRFKKIFVLCFYKILFVLYFYKILLKIILIWTMYRFAMLHQDDNDLKQLV